MSDRLERLLNLVIALRETRRPLQAAEIRERVAGYGHDDHEAFRRMFERDKADLRALGVPLAKVPLDTFDERAGYQIDPTAYDLPEVSFEPSELAALAIALQATGLADEAGSGLLRLAVGTGDVEAARPSAAAPVAIALGDPRWSVLTEAQLERVTVGFTYARPGTPPELRTVDPHALVHRRGRWYLVGHDHDRQARRAFRLDRIVGDVVHRSGPAAFAPPEGAVGVNDVLPPRPGTDAGQAEVLATEEVAWLVARRARGGGRPARPGWTAFTVPVGDPDGFVGWMLELGADVEIVAPAGLRDAVIAALEAVAAHHGGARERGSRR